MDIKKKGNSTKKLTQEFFINECKKNPLSENLDFTNTVYKNIRTDVEIECKLHGIKIVTPRSAMDGHVCSLCIKKDDPSAKIRLTKEEYIIIANEMHNNKYDYSLIDLDIKTEDKKIEIICPTHGKFLARSSAHISPTQLYGCQKCSRGYSRYEERIETFLKSNNIEYEYQKKFDDLVGVSGQKLAYDFYIPFKNLLIEFDGIHHYECVQFGKNQTKESQLNKLKDIRRNDSIKNLFSFEKEIDLIRISYHREKDIEEILSRELLGKTINHRCGTPIICFRVDSKGNHLPGRHIDYSHRG